MCNFNSLDNMTNLEYYYIRRLNQYLAKLLYINYEYTDVMIKKMTNKINKTRRRSMNATPTQPSNKSQWQGAQEDPKQKQDRSQGRAWAGQPPKS
jgi:hypothetical protein